MRRRFEVRLTPLSSKKWIKLDMNINEKRISQRHQHNCKTDNAMKCLQAESRKEFGINRVFNSIIWLRILFVDEKYLKNWTIKFQREFVLKDEVVCPPNSSLGYRVSLFAPRLLDICVHWWFGMSGCISDIFCVAEINC